jgi:tetratricopeptide (TPR) repeat protein
MDDDCLEAHQLLADIYLQLAQWDEVMHHLNHAVLLAPKSAEMQYKMGVALQRQQDIAAASQAFERALTLDPNHEASHIALGNIHLDAQEFALARRHFNRAVLIARDAA